MTDEDRARLLIELVQREDMDITVIDGEIRVTPAWKYEIYESQIAGEVQNLRAELLLMCGAAQYHTTTAIQHAKEGTA